MPKTKTVTHSLGILFALGMVAGFLWMTFTLTHPRMPESNAPPEIYANHVQDDLGQALTHSIQQAQQSVWLMVYTLTDARILQALNQKAQEGIPVYVVVDGKASAKVQSRLNSRVQLIKRFGEGLMHLKILVIDQKQVWLGSANMTGDSLRMHGNLVMGMENPQMAAFIIEHAKNLRPEGEAHAPPPKTFIFPGQDLTLWFLPDQWPAINELKHLIRSAKKKVQIAMFTWTRYDLAREVVAAHERGIEVDVVLDHYAGRGTGAQVVQILKAGGIPVRFSQGTALLHYKCMLIDGETLVNGSANWTKAAFTQNDDCFIVLNNLTNTQKKTLENLWQVLKSESRLAD